MMKLTFGLKSFGVGLWYDLTYDTSGLQNWIPPAIYMAVQNVFQNVTITCALLSSVVFLSLASLLCSALSARIDGHLMKTTTALLQGELTKWRRHHLLLCQFVQHIDSCFGLMILMIVSRSFIFFTMKIYDVISEPYKFLDPRSPFCYAYWAWFLVVFVELSLVIYTPYHLSQKVFLID